jgi:hypothetical protein
MLFALCHWDYISNKSTANFLLNARVTTLLLLQLFQHCDQLIHESIIKKNLNRARIAFRLPSLQQLDLTTVSAEEKIRANNLYNSEGGDLQYR